MTLADLYALMLREYGGSDFLELAMRGDHWVMDHGSYRQVRAAARAAGALYPDDDPGEPRPEDRLFGLPVEVREDGGAPHLVIPARQ